ncbi:hypothetical protein TNCV_2695791 [Trichonephila clavipes]|nr:hypothetical protein TNCV_2695791 [Trichonephila clavipes]
MKSKAWCVRLLRGKVKWTWCTLFCSTHKGIGNNNNNNLCHLIDSNIGSRSTKFIAVKGFLRLSLALSLSTMQVIVRFLLGSTPVLRKNALGVARGLPPLFPFHQPYVRGLEAQ